MNFLGLEIKRKAKNNTPTETKENAESGSSYYFGKGAYGQYYSVVDKVWDGEKTLGELGTVVRNIPDYEKLRLRSYDAYAKSDVVRIVSSKYFYWVIGSGLKLQSEPNRTVLESEGIKGVNYSAFQKLVEARFAVYANSKNACYTNEKTLHELADDAHRCSFLGGDALVIARFGEYGPNIQIISGEHIKNPGLDNNFAVEAEKKGHKIEHGVEIDKKGRHIAYIVRTRSKDELEDEYERIPAYGANTGKRLAWMISSQKISPDHIRSVPEISQSLEKINKLDRYTEAAVGKAEQAAKLLYTIKHREYSTGESHLDAIVNAKRSGVSTISSPTDGQVLADGLANRIAETTSNQTFNLTPGAELESFSTEIETDFAAFHAAIFKTVSSGMNVPPEVAMQEYNSNYSASRAAINSFGYIISIKRAKAALDFYIPIYKLWLEYEILTNKIEAPGYLENIKNYMITESYSQCRFLGKNMPHIDPLKEAKAIELMLQMKLCSREQATEMLGLGQWDENFMKSLEEETIIPEEEDEKVDNSKSKNNEQE
jgi:capsid protein